MRLKQPLGAALTLSLLAAAAPVFAGPAGSGLAHTEWVAKKAAEARAAETVRLTAPSRDCVPALVTALRQHDAVKGVMVEASDLSIQVRTDAKTARAGALESLMARTCAATTAAAAS
ncbi:hypothetical protein [Phenylobacterium sp.]|uniref:hypothetical protein n=1 Tax=Phenylobacterium sp. TaxID=1871053 RepID=UPI0025F4D0F8|nr:hypothetical protein [Phenylobacterium sp.]